MKVRVIRKQWFVGATAQEIETAYETWRKESRERTWLNEELTSHGTNLVLMVSYTE